MRANDGKGFEHDVHEQFRNLHLTLPVHWERVVDSHEAGNLVRKSDCDFKLTVRTSQLGRPWVHYIECKSSVKHESLRNGLRSLVKPTQVAKMRIAERAGVFAWYWFRNENTKMVEIWTGQQIHRVFIEETRLKEDPKLIIPSASLHTLLMKLPDLYRS
jgi:hypothetical protein